MQLPVVLTLQPSRQLALLLLLAHAAALIVVIAIVLPIWVKPTLLLAIGISAWRNLRSLHDLRRIARLTLRSDGRLEYYRSNEESGEARIHPHTTVTAWLCVVLLRHGKRIEVLVVMPDALNDEDFRQLRLWLRWQAVMD
ncbi:MAG: protein YgfX [Pseudomonadota bacterium]